MMDSLIDLRRILYWLTVSTQRRSSMNNDGDDLRVGGKRRCSKTLPSMIRDSSRKVSRSDLKSVH